MRDSCFLVNISETADIGRYQVVLYSALQSDNLFRRFPFTSTNTTLCQKARDANAGLDMQISLAAVIFCFCLNHIVKSQACVGFWP